MSDKAQIMRDFPLNFLCAQPRIRPIWGLCVHLRWSAWFVSDLCAIFPYFSRNSSVIFRRVNQWKWSILSTDKHAQQNLCAIHAFAFYLGCVTGPLRSNALFLRNLCVVYVVLTRKMREICARYQWSSAKMLPLSCASMTFHWRLADIYTCITCITLTYMYHWQKFCCANHAWFIQVRNSLVIVRRSCVIFRGTFVAHHPVLAIFGAFPCLCAGLHGLLVIRAWYFRTLCAIHLWFCFA
jgi:hypothetical protein